MGYHVNIMQCMQLNFLMIGQVYPMLMTSVPQALGHTLQKKYPFGIDCKTFSEGRFCHVLA